METKLKLTVKMIHVDEQEPCVYYVRGEIDGIAELQYLVNEYLDNSTELDLKPGEFYRSVVLNIGRETADDGYGYRYFLYNAKPTKICKYTKKELKLIETRKNNTPLDEFPF